MAQKSISILKHYLPEIKRYKWLLVSLTAVTCLRAVLDLILPFLLRSLVNYYGQPPSIVWSGVERLLWILLAFYACTYILYRATDILLITFILKTTHDLQLRTMRALLRHSYRFFSNSFAGALVSKLIKFRNAFERMTELIYWQFLPQLIRIPVIFIIFLLQKPTLAVFYLAWIILFIVSTLLFVRWKTPLENEASERESNITAVLADQLTNIHAIKSFSSESHEFKHYKEITDSARLSLQRAWFFHIFFFGVWSIFILGFEWFLIYLSAQWWKAGTFTAADFVFLQATALVIFKHVYDIGFKLGNWNREVANATEMARILETKVEVDDISNAKPLKVRQSSIQFSHVTFRYEPKANDALKDFTLSIASGEKVALVGHSGSGKSTVIKLLFRFFDPQTGTISIDRQNIARVTQESLRDALSLVPQDPNLFHRTLAENITYGSTATKPEILDAAKKAHAYDFIQQFPKKFETLVGERGIKLSGGERQRIAIARAILRDSKILVLDEATSSLDSVTEHKIQQAISDCMEGHTTIVIAHRLSTIRKVDRVVVMDQGVIVEQGTHEELLQKNGVFTKLWNAQVSGFID